MPLKQIIKLASPKEHYDSDGSVFWCFDWRLKGLRDAFIQYLGIQYEDLVQVAGGAMALRDRESEGYGFLLAQAIGSWRLHKTKTFHLAIHVDCGAYKLAGLLKAGVDQKEFMEDESKTIRNNLVRDLRSNGCDSEVKVYVADFEGLWETE